MITFKHATLDNGLTIIAETDPDAHSSAVGFFVKTGARDEESPVMGVSHFLEHMMFKGTDALNADQINQGFDDLGARNNAYTTHELTCFYAHVVPDATDDVIDLLAQMMRPALRQDDFDTEKGVILEEIAMYHDNPFWVLYEACCEHHFNRHPMGHRVLGTDDTIKALQRDQMMDYWKHNYAADNTTVALAGAVDFDASVDRIRRWCDDWPESGVRLERKKPSQGAPELNLTDERVARAYLLELTEGPSVQDDRRYAAAMLAQILGSPDNSRLHWALLETGLAEEAQAAFDPHDGFGQFFVYASGDPDRAADIRAEVDKQIDELKDSLVPADLARLLNRFATGVALSGERPNDRMQRLGRTWLALGEYRSLEEELERIQQVTIDELREVSEAFPMKPRTIGTLLPKT